MKYFVDRNSKQVFKNDHRKLRAMGLVNTNIFLSLRLEDIVRSIRLIMLRYVTLITHLSTSREIFAIMNY